MQEGKISISIAITACNEAEELSDLLSILKDTKTSDDEIVIVTDEGNTTIEVYDVIKQYSSIIDIHKEHSLNKNFGEHKNFLYSLCTKDYIFNLDADESFYELELLRNILSINQNIDLFILPRINIVDGITPAHIQKWGWSIMDDVGWINFPDYQGRLSKNSKDIKWSGKVHEKLIGYKTYAYLPATEYYSIRHSKSIEKQEKQNNFYNTI
jgi:glycosyltransferase involved in cell wall biosynthesis